MSDESSNTSELPSPKTVSDMMELTCGEKVAGTKVTRKNTRELLVLVFSEETIARWPQWYLNQLIDEMHTWMVKRGGILFPD